MKQMVSITLGIFLLIAAVWIWFHFFPLRVIKGPDEAWLTRMRLSDMARAISRYYEISDLHARIAISKVRTLDELWLLLQKKFDGAEPIVEVPVEEGFLKDAWGQPYILDMRSSEKETRIRITSGGKKFSQPNGGKEEVYIEIGFDKAKIIYIKHSWVDLGN